jgi:hypothetical protein
MRVPATAGLLALALGATTATAATIEHLPRGAAAVKDCDVTVTYGSYCCGTNGALARKVEAEVKASPHISRAAMHAWGLEGESTLCLKTDSPAETLRLFWTIRGWIPETSKQNWSEVQAMGLSYQTKWPK